MSAEGYEQQFSTAAELWHALSPTERLFPDPSNLIFRGHADASWKLIPSVLRDEQRATARTIMQGREGADSQVWYEARLLEEFGERCDRVGVRIPGDSIALRENALNSQRLDQYTRHPERWPNPDLFEVMAFAQHHGIPTRLLDWCRHPYTAVYFAASCALRNYQRWTDTDRLAVWVFNIEGINLHQGIQVVKPPGSVSPHLAAQSGLFTVQTLNADRGVSLDIRALDDVVLRHGRQDLLKLTVPVTESPALYKYCDKIGINAASLFPGADGAARAVEDSTWLWAAKQWLIDNES